MNMLGLD